MSWTWYAWFVIVLFLVLLPVGYGAGYRRWGPPRPSLYRRSSVPGTPAPLAPGSTAGREDVVTATNRRTHAETPSGWGVLGDLVWMSTIGALIWALVIFFG